MTGKTILLTGITGFTAKRIALDLLNAGHAVRGTLPRTDRTGEVRAALCPDRRIPTRTAPNLLIRAIALLDPAARAAVPILGRRVDLSNARARTEMGIDFTPWRDSLRASVDFLVASR